MAKTLTVYLAADLKKFTSGINEAERGIMGFGNSLSNMLGPALIGAGVAAGAFATKLAVDGVKAAMDEEAALTRLNTTLTNVGWGQQTGQVQEFIDRLQFATGVADDELRPAFDRIARSTDTVTQAQKMLSLALDVAEGSGKSLQSVSDALGKAFDGNTTALGKLGIGLDKATLATGDMDAITSALSQRFSGQAANAASTYEGQIQRTKVAFDELKEAFGQGFLRALGDTNAAVEDASQTMKDMQDNADALGFVLGKTGKVASGFFSDMLQGATNAAGPVGLLARALGYTGQAASNSAPAIAALTARYQGLADAARDAASAEIAANAARGQSAATTRWTAMAVQDYNADITKNGGTLDEWRKSLDAATDSTGRGGAALEKSSPLLEKWTEKIRASIQGLDDEIKALENATRARNDYANAVSGAILGDISLKDVFDPNDVQGSIQKFTDAITGATGFSDALAKLGLSLPDSPGAEAFVQQILGLGTVAGNQFLAGLTPEIANNLVSKLEESITTINGNAFLLANHFYGEGIEAAQQSVDGFIVQIGKEEKRLREIGKNIGKPIGANIKAEIAQAVAEAVKAAEAAKTAAAQERAADIARQQVVVTQQQVANAMAQLLGDANRRATGNAQVLR